MLQNGLLTMARHLNALGVRHAVIGGVAVSAHGVVRATEDIDFLIDAASEEKVRGLMKRLGFETLQRTEDVSNYLLGELRVDFLHAHRTYTATMLDRATSSIVEGVELRIARVEDLIGLKVQALANDPSRTHDRADIEQLLRLPVELDKGLIREYFRIFDREPDLDAILEAIGRGDR